MSSAAKEEVQTTQATSCLCLPIQEEVSQSPSCLRLPILSLSILRRDLFVSAALLLSGVRGAWRGGVGSWWRTDRWLCGAFSCRGALCAMNILLQCATSLPRESLTVCPCLVTVACALLAYLRG